MQHRRRTCLAARLVAGPETGGRPPPAATSERRPWRILIDCKSPLLALGHRAYGSCWSPPHDFVPRRSVDERQSASPIVSSWSILFLRTIHELECSKRGQDVTTVVVNSLIAGKVELSPHAIGVARLVFGYDFLARSLMALNWARSKCKPSPSMKRPCLRMKVAMGIDVSLM